MDGLLHLSEFIRSASNDPRISPSHISLYMSIFQQWILNQCDDPIYISRAEVMKTAKISGIATYHKCIKDLNKYGYIKYMPSYNPERNTKVFLSFSSST